jgi:hypothetical protein
MVHTPEAQAGSRSPYRRSHLLSRQFILLGGVQHVPSLFDVGVHLLDQ